MIFFLWILAICKPYVFMLLSDFEVLHMYIAYGYRVATEIHNELTIA